MAHRTQITLTDEQYARLRVLADRDGVSLAELIRRAVDRTYAGDWREALRQSAGVWADRDFDGKTYVERIRPGKAKRLEKISGRAE